MNKSRLSLIVLGLVALAGAALAQSGAFPNYPIVGGAAYCTSTTNGVCTNTVPAGPTAITGAEQIPANTALPSGQSPQNVLISPAMLGALPINIYTATALGPTLAVVSASSVSGGVVFISGGTITTANVSLPLTPVDNQRYEISSAVTLTALKVSVYPTSTATINATAVTGLTASATVGNGYTYVYKLSDNKWYRLR